MGFRPTFEIGDNVDLTGGELDYTYIRLAEVPVSWILNDNSTWTDRNREDIEGRMKFLNDFIEEALVRGKRLTWEGGVIGWEPCKLPLGGFLSSLYGVDFR